MPSVKNSHSRSASRCEAARWLFAVGLLVVLAACSDAGPPVSPPSEEKEIPLPPPPSVDPVPEAVAYPESLLCPEPPGTDARCGTPYVPANALTEEELAARYSAGLNAWRYEGTRGACAGCHSPDAIELARVGYTDADLRRRAVTHVDEARASAIIELVRVVRQRHGMTRLLHPARFRPLQPAYEPFAARTPGLPVHDSAAQSERDEAFMDHLVGDRQLLWATGRIDSLAKARQAYDELHAIDLRHLRLGLPFDHLAEDGFHGNEHRSVFEWFPDLASSPRAAVREEWYQRVDAYLSQPTDQNLWGYYDAAKDLTECNPDLGGARLEDYPRACEWMRLKYRSLQVFQHMLRHGTHRHPDFLVDVDSSGGTPRIPDHLEKVIARNPIWETGDHLRIQPLARPAQTACNATNHPCTLLPPIIDQTIHDTPSYTEARIKQSQVFQQTWFVMSFLRDPALLYEGDSFATFIGDYLESVLLPFYDVHHAFVFAKMAVEKSSAQGWMEAEGFRAGTGKLASVRTFSFKQLRDNFSPPPSGNRRRPVHDRMFANFARMFIYLVEEDLTRTGEVFDRTEVLYAVRFMRTWILRLEGAEDADINARVRSIEALAAAARELRTEANRRENPGTGLQPNNRWGEFTAPYGG
ncbi:hypothetical protein HUA76_14005 [Myxococcus sp. CA056]|uniref:hypothetical protein n=1 Tax=Myxococcus sp. CA056 TaxID=2741740 RepID=UPI00157A3BF4|nr:hypothetical protein [Myxococcus sp. CA056]NTX11909.1 hypothetical protein [Myxococcus sp. CA056]